MTRNIQCQTITRKCLNLNKTIKMAAYFDKVTNIYINT